MKIALSAHVAWLAVGAVLSGCVYYAPALQRTYGFDQHPGVTAEVWQQYDAYGVGYPVTTIFNRSNMDKCAWTDQVDSRLLRPGESWQVPAPGAITVANPVPGDPNCFNAKRGYR